ncbi:MULTISPECIES: hypothetical protein [unclassified Sphingobacterium]|uniref:hypothetical protein n=1 Tax=unclassified Sphingobacterium TaxID=2609468 RepID=UPI0020C2C352|nr:MULTISPECIES: hypothetical protein [unclassified Sphingobacterium]
MTTEIENLQEQVNALQENTDLITQDIVRIMPTIVSLLSANEKAMQEFHDMRAKDQEHLSHIKAFIKQENVILSKIIKDYGSLEDVANRSSETTRKHLSILTKKENEIVAKISQIPDKVNIRHLYGVDLKSTPVIIIIILFSVVISLGLGMLLEKDRQIGDKTSYEMRYRMIALDLPNVTAQIDSAYSLNSDKFHDLVIKREEENKLLYSIDRSREEIKKLKEIE